MKKKTNHKIMKKRNTKKNTKRKMNKRNKRNKSLKRNKKIRFTRKKLYGGNPERIKELIVTIMTIGPMNFLINDPHFKEDPIFEKLNPFEVKENLKRGHWKNLKFPSTHSSLDGGVLYPLFRFWHKYGCVLSDNTLYKLYINLFFHSIYSQIAQGDTPIPASAGSEELYDEIINSYPVTRDLAIVFYKLKHLCDDLKVADIEFNKIFNFVQYILEILTNIIILKHLGFTFSRKNGFLFIGLVERTPEFILNITNMVPLLREYIDSGIFSGYIQRDYGEFNAAMVTGVFHLDGVGRYSLDELKIKLEGTGDPILELNKGDTHPNTPTEEGVPEPEPA